MGHKLLKWVLWLFHLNDIWLPLSFKFPPTKQGKNKNQKTNNFVNLQVGINICSYETELENDLLYSITIPAQQGNLF